MLLVWSSSSYTGTVCECIVSHRRTQKLIKSSHVMPSPFLPSFFIHDDTRNYITYQKCPRRSRYDEKEEEEGSVSKIKYQGSETMERDLLLIYVLFLYNIVVHKIIDKESYVHFLLLLCGWVSGNYIPHDLRCSNSLSVNKINKRDRRIWDKRKCTGIGINI